MSSGPAGPFQRVDHRVQEEKLYSARQDCPGRAVCTLGERGLPGTTPARTAYTLGSCLVNQAWAITPQDIHLSPLRPTWGLNS